MSEKIKVVQSEPIEVSETEDKKRNWKGIIAGVAVGVVATVVAAVAYSKFSDSDDEDEFEDTTSWIPIPEPTENAS